MSAILKFIRENHILALIEQAVVKKKSRLSLNAFEITEIPGLLYTCLDIEHLYLHKNKIIIVPVEITQLTNLTTLTLDYNNITSLPPEIGNLKNLVNLNISYNPLNVLIPEIGDLENLEAFWCNKIGLREIPKEIGKLEKLDTFGARGNELRTLPDEMTKLTKLRWLTLENNLIETLPNNMEKMESLVHCNLRNNQLRDFPMCLLKCQDIMFIQLNNNLITSMPEQFDTSFISGLEMIDLRYNPICDLPHAEHPLVRYSEELPAQGHTSDLSQSPNSRAHGAQALAINATALRLPAVPAARHPDPIVLGNAALEFNEMNEDLDGPSPSHSNYGTTGETLVINRTELRLPYQPIIFEVDLDASSVESEDWENSVNSSELDVQYQSDEERAENEMAQFLQAVGMVLPELSRYASTAS